MFRLSLNVGMTIDTFNALTCSFSSRYFPFSHAKKNKYFAYMRLSTFRRKLLISFCLMPFKIESFFMYFFGEGM